MTQLLAAVLHLLAQGAIVDPKPKRSLIEPKAWIDDVDVIVVVKLRRDMLGGNVNGRDFRRRSNSSLPEAGCAPSAYSSVALFHHDHETSFLLDSPDKSFQPFQMFQSFKPLETHSRAFDTPNKSAK